MARPCSRLASLKALQKPRPQSRRYFGALSDWLGRRKFLAVLGYGLAAFTKPIFPLASSVSWLVAARFIDRIGKGIRGAPRDALIADIAPTHLHGASFGLRQSLDTVGAFLGPALAIGLMWLTANNFHAVFWGAVIPAFLAVGLLLFAVHEPERDPGLRKVRSPMSRAELKRLGSAYWWVVGIAVVFSIARFSEAFLILRAQSVGLPLMLVPMVLVLMNVVYAVAAYPAGVLSDNANRITVLGVGFGILVAADLVLAFTGGIVGVAVGVVLWGLHMGFTQGLLATLVADTAPRSCAVRPMAFSICWLDLHCLSRAFSPECFGIASGLRPLSSQARHSPSLLSSVLLRPDVSHRPSAKRRCPVRGRLCCKSPKMPCDQFLANGANELKSPVDVASRPLPRPPVSSSQIT